jgi:hypothetical protein
MAKLRGCHICHDRRSLEDIISGYATKAYVHDKILSPPPSWQETVSKANWRD